MAKAEDIRAQFADESEMRERANFLAAEGSRYGLSADEQTELLNALCAWLDDMTPPTKNQGGKQWT